MIENIYSSPIDFLKNEFKTIDFIRNNLVVARNYSHLLGISNDIFQKHNKRIDKITSFHFESYFDVIFHDNVRTIFFGTTINLSSKKSISDISYYFSICRENNDDKLMLRKFHFDFTNPNNYRKTPQPIYHLQYGGELTPIQKDCEICGDDQIISWLSEPRIYFSPMSLAILLNIAFVEFQDETIKKICDDTCWKSIVAENEDLIMKPYFNLCKDFFDKKSTGAISNNKIFTTDYCYAN